MILCGKGWWKKLEICIGRFLLCDVYESVDVCKRVLVGEIFGNFALCDSDAEYVRTTTKSA